MGSEARKQYTGVYINGPNPKTRRIATCVKNKFRVAEIHPKGKPMISVGLANLSTPFGPLLVRTLRLSLWQKHNKTDSTGGTSDVIVLKHEKRA